jgi:hypothetical protein
MEDSKLVKLNAIGRLKGIGPGITILASFD